MTDTVNITTYRLELAEKHIEDQEREIQALRDDLKNLRTEIVDRERKNLWWGISVLGSFVLTLGGVIWTYRGEIFK